MKIFFKYLSAFGFYFMKKYTCIKLEHTKLRNLTFFGTKMVSYLSGLNMMAAKLNKEQQAMVAAKTKKPN